MTTGQRRSGVESARGAHAVVRSRRVAHGRAPAAFDQAVSRGPAVAGARNRRTRPRGVAVGGWPRGVVRVAGRAGQHHGRRRLRGGALHQQACFGGTCGGDALPRGRKQDPGDHRAAVDRAGGVQGRRRCRPSSRRSWSPYCCSEWRCSSATDTSPMAATYAFPDRVHPASPDVLHASGGQRARLLVRERRHHADDASSSACWRSASCGWSRARRPPACRAARRRSSSSRSTSSTTR